MYGFLGYPILQAADIVIYGVKDVPLCVPVGEDQVSHVEFSRELVRRFNTFFGLGWKDGVDLAPIASAILANMSREKPNMPQLAEEHSSDSSYALAMMRQLALKDGIDNFREKTPHFDKYFEFENKLVEPQAMLTKTPRIPGLDGRKMSKSYGNTITLSESDADIRAKTKVMVTDPARKRRTDPGNPDVCPVYDWHKLFSAEEPGRLEWVRKGCTTAGIGCIECKAAMADNLIKWIAPVRERRVQYENNPKRVLEILDAGSKQARVVAQGTMQRVREAVFGWEKKRKEIDGTAGTAKA
jgi:tryptophanyl-tRNA synthetase